MNKDDLAAELRKLGIRDDAYDLGGGHLTETYTFGESYGTWFVYYSERGRESDRREFDTETEACEYFLDLVASDPTTRM